MQQVVLTLVSGNASWWKSRKYRKETARRLRMLKRAGWKLASFERLASRGVDTRRRTAYHFTRSSADAWISNGFQTPSASAAEGWGKGERDGEGRALS